MCCENVVLSEVILTRISRFSNETSLNPDKHDWNIAKERPASGNMSKSRPEESYRWCLGCGLGRIIWARHDV
jgi:hypothetical protein